jgi:tripeptide aminopeptidase
MINKETPEGTTVIENGLLSSLIVPRFMNYVRYGTTSDRRVRDTPSTAGQWELAKALARELQGLGLSDVELTSHCYVIARLPPTAGKEGAPVVGFMAHMDTASDVPGE